MTKFIGDKDYKHGSESKVGVLLTNLGTPDAPTAAALRRYLGEFLWDPRVVEMLRPLWWLILHGAVLRLRPARSARAYAKVWDDQGSPLLTISRRQEAALQAWLDARLPGPVRVALGMRYGGPSIAEAMDGLRAAGVRRLLVLPLYPQYSGTTTASTFDAVAAVLKTWRWIPELRMVGDYHDAPGYIDALAAAIQDARAHQAPAERLLMSFHGLPKRLLLAGDPYYCQCRATARLLAARLDLPADRWAFSFQSRFGAQEWLKPYTDHTLEDWARSGIKVVDVVSPGFPADCLETLEEMAMQNRDLFLQAGGEEYRYIPALNDRPDHIEFLGGLVQRHLQGWPEAAAGFDGEGLAREREQARERAREAGCG